MKLSYIRAQAAIWYTLASGGFLLLQGTSTLLFRLVPALDIAFPALLGTTHMIPIHSMLHIVTGLLALALLGWGGASGAWWFALGFGTFYTLLGLVGLITGLQLGLGLQPFDHPFHLLAGLPGLVAAGLSYTSNGLFKATEAIVITEEHTHSNQRRFVIAGLFERGAASMPYPGTPIAWPLRAWFGVEIFFGVSAVFSIGLDPANTSTNFAWNIQPVVMASVLGAYYISSALLFVLPLFARRWEMIRVMILPTALFSTAELIATVLHWSRFSIGTVQFTGWFLSYLLPPPIFVGYYFWQERRARQLASVVPNEPLPTDVRRALIHWGGLLGILAIFFFIVPQALIAIAPWQMTPLTVRAFVSWLLAAAALMLSMAYENDRTRVLVGTPMLILIFPVVTIQIARFADQVQFANVTLFVFYGITLVAFALGIYLARGDWRRALR